MMKAAIARNYGPASRLRLEDIPIPEPGPLEIRVRVSHSSVNPYDWRIFNAEPFFVRFSYGLLKPTHPVMGADFAGMVDKVGKEVTAFQPGDRVAGELKWGAWAEYCLAPVSLAVKLPDEVTSEAAAATPLAGVTALQGVRDHGRVRSGQQVLVNGATGGVGSYAVQIAKVLGAEVTAVCRTGNIERVIALGADHVIDYTKDDVRIAGRKWDLVMDNVGNLLPADYRKLIKDGGCGLMVGFKDMSTMLKFMLSQRKVARPGKPRLVSYTAQPNSKDMQQLMQCLAEERIKAPVSHRFPLQQITEAAALVEDGHAPGKVVVDIS